MRLVDVAAGERAHQRVIADLFAESRHHCGDLGVEHRGRDGAEPQHEDLDILPPRMDHLHDVPVGEQPAERGEVEVRRLGVDHRDVVGAGELHDAQLRPVGALAHELGVDAHEPLVGEAPAQRIQRRRRLDQHGGREGVSVGSGHGRLLQRVAASVKPALTCRIG